MPKSLQPNARPALLNLPCWLLPVLTIALCCSGCAQPLPPTPPVLFNPARIQAPDPILMQPPLPPGTYSANVRAKLSNWESRLRTSPSDSGGSKPGQQVP